jgi:hypothetical protein
MATKDTAHVFVQDPAVFALRCKECGNGLGSPIHVRTLDQQVPKRDGEQPVFIRGVASPEKEG